MLGHLAIRRRLVGRTDPAPSVATSWPKSTCLAESQRVQTSGVGAMRNVSGSVIRLLILASEKNNSESQNGLDRFADVEI